MISVVIPAYNEEGIIAQTIASAREVLVSKNLQPFEILVVDDGSSDQTADLASAAGVKVLRHPHNMGYGRSLKDGITAASYDTIVIVDADGTYPLERIPDLVGVFNKGFNLVVGARQGRNLDSSLLKKGLRWVLKWMVEFTTGRPIADINSGLRVFSKKEIVPFFPTLSNAFSFTTSMTLAYMMSSLYVSFVPIDYHKRVGQAKVRLFRDALRTIQYISEAILIYNPLKLFLVLAGFVALGSLVLLGGGLALEDPSFFHLSIMGFFVSALIMAMGFLGMILKEILHQAPRR
jgi:glycosyltransferase involved in cell wall biosynthesis